MPDSHAASVHHAHGGHAVAHQFDDAEQQFGAASLGMWIFLVTEVMFFGALLTAYAIYFVTFVDAFEDASNHLSLPLGALNTIILLTSSLTMVRSVHAAQTADSRTQVRWLVHCEHGVRSRSACQMLQQLGFGQLVNLRGGLAQWVADGLPLG